MRRALISEINHELWRLDQLDALPGFSVSWEPSTAEVSEQAALGHTIGSYVLTVDGPEGTPVETEGKYLTTLAQAAGRLLEGDGRLLQHQCAAPGLPNKAGPRNRHEGTVAAGRIRAGRR